MKDSYKKLTDLVAKVTNLGSIAALMHWDSKTMMPEGSMRYKSEEISLLQELSHKIMCSRRFGELLEGVQTSKLGKWEKRNIQLIRRSRDSVLAIDPKLSEELTKVSMECGTHWEEARKKKSFKHVLTHFKKLVGLVREMAEARSNYFHCDQYTALLDMYDPKRNIKDVEKIVDSLKGFLPDFVKEVSEKQKSWKQEEIKPKKVSADKQKELGLFCMKTIGFDFKRGRLDKSAHPFCGGGTRDVRITTRYNEEDFVSSLMGIIHETGHAMYQLGLPEKYILQPVGDHSGLSVHESQSLLMEIQISRSREFCEFLAPHMQKILGVSGKGCSPENIYRMRNKVTPSMIRVDADEVTYLLHVILRFELERDILSGDLPLEDLPSAWNKKMEDYLGIKPSNDAEGCLQDMHWYNGVFGYFPTYMLGSMLSAQFFDAMQSSNKDTLKNIKSGKFKPIIKWLHDNIHSRGSLMDVSDLVTKVTGRDIDSEWYKEFLKNKFLKD